MNIRIFLPLPFHNSNILFYFVFQNNHEFVSFLSLIAIHPSKSTHNGQSYYRQTRDLVEANQDKKIRRHLVLHGLFGFIRLS